MKKHTWILIALFVGMIGGGLLYRYFAQERDSRGATRLMRALEENDTAKIAKLLSQEEILARDKSGQTALFYAARHAQQPQIIHQLLLAGADTLTTDKQGNTPLINAAKHNPNPTIILVLARQGGFSPEQIRNKNEALLVAARYNTAAVIKTLLTAHASPTATDLHNHRAADYLAQNEQLSEQEKTDLRQVMLLLEILEGREQFATATSSAKPNSPTVQEKEKTSNTQISKTKPQADKPAVRPANSAHP